MSLIINNYQELVSQISETYQQGRQKAAVAVNSQIIDTYWSIGQYIVEFEQGGKTKAEYGKALIDNLANDLTILHGKGFSRSNLIYMRLFYLKYPISQKPSHLLSWSHYVELTKIDDDLERSFYEKQAIIEKWSVPELKRQKNTSLFARLALSTDKEGMLQLAKQGHSVQEPTDILKEPFVFEFLKIPENTQLSENDLEKRLMDNLQTFLLELGKGFTFVGRQYRITLDNTNYYVDLVFYHRILRCFVLVDLKIRKVKHHDIGQMNMYMGYFAKEQNIEGDNPPIGIILTQEKDDLLVEYATYGMSSQLFVSKYQLYLPNRDELKRLIESQL
jgi:predicted nuclease of restriction endonuclease-like (RecB) superfamily